MQSFSKFLQRSIREAERRGYNAGSADVAEEVIKYISEYDNEDIYLKTKNLLERVYNILSERHDVEVTEDIKGKIDTEVCRVVEVEGEGDIRKFIEIRRGYKLGGKVVKPVLLKMVEGKKGDRDRINYGTEVVRNERLILLESGYNAKISGGPGDSGGTA